MYVFTINGNFNAVLDMPFQEAERYAIRRMVSCGGVPSWCKLHGDAPDYTIAEYVSSEDRMIIGRLFTLTTLSSLDAKSAYPEVETYELFTRWQQFTHEAHEHIDNNDDDDNNYYQWPWPIP